MHGAVDLGSTDIPEDILDLGTRALVPTSQRQSRGWMIYRRR